MHGLDNPGAMEGAHRRFRDRSRMDSDIGRPPREVLRPEFLAGLKRLDLIAKVMLRGFLQGLHRTPRKGFSAEFSDYRNFVAGDDSRWIDWRLYARTDRMFVKQFEAESALRATLVLDCSASMAYCSKQTGVAAPCFSKLEYAVALASALAYLLHHQRDRVGLLCVGGAEGDLHIPPRSSRNHLTRVMRQLSSLKGKGDADIATRLANLASYEKRKGLIVVCTDALTGRASFGEAIKRLRYRGHDVIVFQIWDPAELEPPIFKGLAIKDPETQARYSPLPREEYIRRAREHLEGVRSICFSTGCEHLFMLTTSAFDKALFRFLRMRRARH